MKCTKKDFTAIAGTLNRTLVKAQQEDKHIARFLIEKHIPMWADFFASTNPRFDREKFLTACGIEGSRT